MATSSGAADTASIEFHVATCPPGYDGSDYFDDCSDNGTDDVTFTVDGLNTGYSDSATSNVPVNPGFGIAVIDNLPADTFTMSEDVPGDFVSLWVYCADSPGGGERIPTPGERLPAVRYRARRGSGSHLRLVHHAGPTADRPSHPAADQIHLRTRL